MDRLNFRLGTLQLIDAKFPTKGPTICFHLCYLFAKSSNSQHYTSQTPVMLYPLQTKSCSWQYPLLSTFSSLYDAWSAQFRTAKNGGKVRCTRTEYTYCQNAFFVILHVILILVLTCYEDTNPFCKNY
jgi:hypothetical protein